MTQPATNESQNETCPAELPNFCAQRHWSIFWILIICSLATLTGRVMTVQNYQSKGESPFFSANDRSRWCTIRALGDHGTYEIDEVIRRDQPIDWDSIDKVRHDGADGQLHFYSSKPTLLPTMLAGVYRSIKFVTGWDLSNDTLPVVRLMLLVFGVLPWAVYLYFMAKTINSVPVRDWARYYVLACAGFGTYLSTFSTTLNNHVPAAIGVMIALYCLSVIWRKKDAHWFYFAGCGLFAAFAAANELPALSFFALAGLFCLVRSIPKTLIAFVPTAALVAAGFFGTNYLAHGEFKPAYSHRSDGDTVATVSGDFQAQLNQKQFPTELRIEAEKHFEFKIPFIEKGSWPSLSDDEVRWVVRDEVSPTQFSIVQIGVDSNGANSNVASEFEIRAWDNWYDYPGSYWLDVNADKKSEVDRGQKSQELYAFHVLFGHHGIFSLTPIWLLSLAGMFSLLFGAKLAGSFQMRWLGLMGVALSVLVVSFYLVRPEMDRNYGGVTSALRWLFWLAPIWLVCMLPVVDWLARSRTGKAICYVLLTLSVVSACYSLANPWVHPWLYEVWHLTGLPQ